MSLDMASPAVDNEKHLGSQNQDEQNLERHGYVQQTKRNFSLTAMVATCVNLMATKLRNRSNRSTVSSDRSIYIDQGLQSIDIDRFGSTF
ncbi:hypothetical protein V3481_006083 [Fusarium oxysporum f. sp. vasinfectum]